MTRNEAMELLERYNEYLIDDGHTDEMLYSDRLITIDSFLGTKWAKEKFPLTDVHEIEKYRSMTPDELSEYIKTIKAC